VIHQEQALSPLPERKQHLNKKPSQSKRMVVPNVVSGAAGAFPTMRSTIITASNGRSQPTKVLRRSSLRNGQTRMTINPR